MAVTPRQYGAVSVLPWPMSGAKDRDMQMRTGLRAAAFMVASMTLGSAACAGEHLFDSGFDHRAEGPYSQADAARFLTQATFGPTLAEIERLRAIGYNSWLAEQAAAAPSLHRPYLEAQAAAGLNIYQNSRQEAWWLHALRGPDQLRQRVAFALSELLVNRPGRRDRGLSDRDGELLRHPRQQRLRQLPQPA